MGLVSKIKSNIKNRNLLDYAMTFGVEFLILVISIALFKLINIRFETIGFSEFTISKRLVGFLMPLLMIGLGVSLPKFLPLETSEKQLKIHYTAIIIISSLFIICCLMVLIFPGFYSQLVFGSPFHKKLIFANLLFVYSLMAHACVYNFFRGKFNFKASSLIQLLNLGILPLVCCFFTHNILNYFILLSVLTLLFLVIISIKYIPFIKLTLTDWKVCFIMLTQYGIQRMPGDVILGLFLALPTFIASNYFSIIEAGSIAFCLSLFNIIIAFMSPINIILLPKASKIVFDKDFVQLKEISGKLLTLSLAVGVASVIGILILAEYILLFFKVKDLVETAVFLKIIFTGVIGYSVFSIIRSIIDAFYAQARNTLNILIAFLAFVFFIFTLNFMNIFTLKNTVIVFSISINLLGVITYYSLVKINKLA